MMCVEGFSPNFPSNSRILDGKLEGIADHRGLWEIGSFFNREKSCKYNFFRKVKGENEYWEGGEVSAIPDGPCTPHIFVLLGGSGYTKE
jgi:hypothetical protein